jgi:hypothetical protein
MKKSVYDIALDIPVQHGDLVVYAFKQSLRYVGALGIVVGTDDDGRNLVMWCLKRSNKMLFEIHEPATLCVLSRGSVDEAAPEELPEAVVPKPGSFFAVKRNS